MRARVSSKTSVRVWRSCTSTRGRGSFRAAPTAPWKCASCLRETWLCSPSTNSKSNLLGPWHVHLLSRQYFLTFHCERPYMCLFHVLRRSLAICAQLVGWSYIMQSCCWKSSKYALSEGILQILCHGSWDSKFNLFYLFLIYLILYRRNIASLW